jgi:hypothetical protein
MSLAISEVLMQGSQKLMIDRRVNGVLVRKLNGTSRFLVGGSPKSIGVRDDVSQSVCSTAQEQHHDHGFSRTTRPCLLRE